jgi:malate dehydrogenase (oxaloacetate-decarboxylating)
LLTFNDDIQGTAAVVLGAIVARLARDKTLAFRRLMTPPNYCAPTAVHEERLRDPAYLGWPHERIGGQQYFDFIDQFVQAVKQELPEVCLQWEDFATPHARPLLDRYQDQLLTFNDDIQGTAAVVLGAIVGAVKVAGKSLKDQQIVFLGGGSAGIGVADYLCAAMIREGLSEQEARGRFWIVDKDGLFDSSRSDLTAEQSVYAHPSERVSAWVRTAEGRIQLDEVIRKVDASILIGLSTAAGAFCEPIVREMARKCARPIIFPLSNPTLKSEARPEDLIRWTNGRAIIATGSPYAPVSFAGRKIPIAQCNNIYVFPAMGLGLVASRARRATDAMFLAAGRVLGESSPALNDPAGPLLPAIADIRQVAVEIAIAVGLEAQRSGFAPRANEEELRKRVRETQWFPSYSESESA